jgi:hypothetical protein
MRERHADQHQNGMLQHQESQPRITHGLRQRTETDGSEQPDDETDEHLNIHRDDIGQSQPIIK